jgi:spermidine synthase
MKSRTLLVSTLLFGSGACALVYQTVWLREFRMIFGGSTAASAAVLAVFMGGLGAGGLVLGRRVDRNERPLRFYAHLELLIAVVVALSPAILWMVRAGYFALGGEAAIGHFAATLCRLLLATLVLGLPTFLMGGTLPAAGRAVETADDVRRSNLAVIYGANTLGAVAGVLLSTFYLLEQLGNRNTLWVACAANAVVALAAMAVSRSTTPAATAAAPKAQESSKPAAPVFFVLIAAAVVGFVFLLMEIVWYRMMTPLLGGTTFTFGLILAGALLGIGLGGAAYSFFGTNRRPTLSAFAFTCAIEALFLAAPYALGDRIALWALLMRSLGAVGFHGDILAWTQLTAVIVFPTAFIAGWQFPLLIGLLGKGREKVGSHIGAAYACNTLGAIVGSLAGGFGLLPALSATGVWKFAIAVLAVLGACSWVIAYRTERRFIRILVPAGVTAAALVMLFATGPTATWRQSAIGAGRANDRSVTGRQRVEEWLRLQRRYLLLQEDGTESTLGITTRRSITFLINGKSDGNAWGDAGTQVMSGLLGAILQPKATRSLVVGLGTGSTVGWLADIPAMERVDVIELEKAVVKVAELCGPVNRNVLSNPKVHHAFGDARETLLTTREDYDLIVSEPSNPYRAGVASLYTKEYYQAAARRLRPGGLFLQFVQAYEVDGATIRSIYATFGSTFPVVETWQTSESDLLFVGSMEPRQYDVEALRARIAEPPFKLALEKVWRVNDVEGFLSHFVANEAFARDIVAGTKSFVNTDDRNRIEFGFARSVGKLWGLRIGELREAAYRRSQHRPAMIGDVDWNSVQEQNLTMDVHLGTPRPSAPSFATEEQRRRWAAISAYVAGAPQEALNLWSQQARDAKGLTENAMVAHMFAWAGDARAMDYIERVAATHPGEASMLTGFLRARQGRFTEAADAIESAYLSLRTDPWMMSPVAARSYEVAQWVAAQDPSGAVALRFFRALEQPFSVYVFDEDRRKAFALIAAQADRGRPGKYTQQAMHTFEPNVPWDRQFLKVRRDCYRETGDPLLAKAEADLARFIEAEAEPVDANPNFLPQENPTRESSD